MTFQIEYASMRGIDTFPAHWGLPEGSRMSQERESWIFRNIATDQTLERRGLNAAKVRSGLNATEVRAGKMPRTSATEALAKVTALR